MTQSYVSYYLELRTRGSGGAELSEASPALGTQFPLWRFPRQGAWELAVDEAEVGAWPGVPPPLQVAPPRPSRCSGAPGPGFGLQRPPLTALSRRTTREGVSCDARR